MFDFIREEEYDFLSMEKKRNLTCGVSPRGIYGRLMPFSEKTTSWTKENKTILLIGVLPPDDNVGCLCTRGGQLLKTL